MAPTVSKEAAIATAVVAGIAVPAVLVGYLYREKTEEIAQSTYAAVAAQASAVGAKSSEALKAVQASATASYTSVASSASQAVESVKNFFKKAKSRRTLRRVRSFPIAPEEDDVAAGKDQKSKSHKKLAKKATQELEKMGVPVQVTAK